MRRSLILAALADRVPSRAARGRRPRRCRGLTPFRCPRCRSRAGSSARASGRAKARPASTSIRARVDPTLGNPTSILTYDDIDGYSGEFFFNVRNEYDTFFKGFVGGGGLTGGSLDDEDFAAGQVKFSDTYSKLDGNGLVYGTMDIGQRLALIEAALRLHRGEPVHRLQFLAGAPARLRRPLQSRRRRQYQLPARRRGRALLHQGHRQRGELGIAPARRRAAHDILEQADPDRRRGRSCPSPMCGITTAIICARTWAASPISRTVAPAGAISSKPRRASTSRPSWSAGAGVRYWYAEAGGNSEFANFGLKVPLNDYTSERFGVFGDVTYRFATF